MPASRCRGARPNRQSARDRVLDDGGHRARPAQHCRPDRIPWRDRATRGGLAVGTGAEAADDSIVERHIDGVEHATGGGSDRCPQTRADDSVLLDAKQTGSVAEGLELGDVRGPVRGKNTMSAAAAGSPSICSIAWKRSGSFRSARGMARNRQTCSDVPSLCRDDHSPDVRQARRTCGTAVGRWRSEKWRSRVQCECITPRRRLHSLRN